MVGVALVVVVPEVGVALVVVVSVGRSVWVSVTFVEGVVVLPGACTVVVVGSG